ncbi:MAG: single-stranded DNA-binding protein [Planctomycetaceae bacterium]|nr:single-stranded DNA-binding protein [Planctomycetaceae bacterium]
MATDLNLCQFIGRLGKDPEIRYTASGDAVASFSIAVNKSWTRGSDKEQRTTWVNVVAFRKLAEIMGKYLRKGSRIYVSGEFSVRTWEDKEGARRYTTEIIANQMQMLDEKPASSGERNSPEQKAATDFNAGDFYDDDLEF